jgi:glucose/arabinose dehydrogenase
MRLQPTPSPVRRAGLCLSASVLLAGPAAAAVPAGFVERTVTSGLSDPTAMAFAPDGRLFVCQQSGALRVITADGRLLPTPFVSLTVNRPPDSERGLLGVAFDPDFATTPYVYVYYTTSSGGAHNRISRFLAAGDVAGGAEEILVELDPLSGATNHNGGALHFGPDGKLYAAVGENADGNHAQDFGNRHGKILRYNKDGTIPPDNPFLVETTGANQSIWAMGLRNPFTFGFDPTGARMYINDVGQNTFEEINLGVAGANYGWPMHEGVAEEPPFRDPLLVYGHGSGATTGCAIVGGAFQDPSRGIWPEAYTNDYFFADLCNGWIRRFDAAAQPPTNSSFASGYSGLVDLRIGTEGALYYLARGSGSVGRIAPDLIWRDGFED